MGRRSTVWRLSGGADVRRRAESSPRCPPRMATSTSRSTSGGRHAPGARRPSRAEGDPARRVTPQPMRGLPRPSPALRGDPPFGADSAWRREESGCAYPHRPHVTSRRHHIHDGGVRVTSPLAGVERLALSRYGEMASTAIALITSGRQGFRSNRTVGTTLARSDYRRSTHQTFWRRHHARHVHRDQRR